MHAFHVPRANPHRTTCEALRSHRLPKLSIRKPCSLISSTSPKNHHVDFSWSTLVNLYCSYFPVLFACLCCWFKLIFLLFVLISTDKRVSSPQLALPPSEETVGNAEGCTGLVYAFQFLPWMWPWKSLWWTSQIFSLDTWIRDLRDLFERYVLKEIKDCS